MLFIATLGGNEMRELIDTELDTVCGGHHGHHHGHHGLFDFGKLGNIVNFGSIVIQENIVEQIAVAIGANATAINIGGNNTNFAQIG
jgi:hypothetical protein